MRKPHSRLPFAALALSTLLLAGCATPVAAPTHAHAADTGTATMAGMAGMTTAPPAPKAPPPLPPQVGTCDITVTSAGTGTGAVRYGSCPVAQALPSLSKDTRSLLVEITWDSLPASALALHSTLENAARCNSGDPTSFMTACSEMAMNASMASPVRLVVEGKDYADFGAGATAFENIYSGAAAQQAFHLAFSAFYQEHVPANYTALK